jgi:hypothetical protein
VSAELVSIAVARPSAPYGEEMGPAHAFVADAAAHARELAEALGATLQELVGPAATRAAVADAIRAAAARLRAAPTGLFVLTYAGHGARMPDRSGDEGPDDGFDEAWALDDRPLTDDHLTPLLADLHADVHVVLISNCCYSAGIADDLVGGARVQPRPGLPPLRRRALGSSDALPAVDAEGRARVAAKVTAGAPDPAGAIAGGPEPEPEPTNRVLIAACGDDQVMVLPDASRLTAHLLDVVFPRAGGARRRAPTDYATIEATVRQLASVTQTPMVLATDPDKRRLAFVAQPRRPR